MGDRKLMNVSEEFIFLSAFQDLETLGCILAHQWVDPAASSEVLPCGENLVTVVATGLRVSHRAPSGVWRFRRP